MSKVMRGNVTLGSEIVNRHLVDASTHHPALIAEIDEVLGSYHDAAEQYRNAPRPPPSSEQILAVVHRWLRDDTNMATKLTLEPRAVRILVTALLARFTPPPPTDLYTVQLAQYWFAHGFFKQANDILCNALYSVKATPVKPEWQHDGLHAVTGNLSEKS